MPPRPLADEPLPGLGRKVVRIAAAPAPAPVAVGTAVGAAEVRDIISEARQNCMRFCDGCRQFNPGPDECPRGDREFEEAEIADAAYELGFEAHELPTVHAAYKEYRESLCRKSK